MALHFLLTTYEYDPGKLIGQFGCFIADTDSCGCWNRAQKMRLSWRWLTTDRWWYTGSR